MSLVTLKSSRGGYPRRPNPRCGRWAAGVLNLVLVLITLLTASAQTPGEPKPFPPDLTELSLTDLMKVQVQNVYGASKYFREARNDLAVTSQPCR